MDYGHSRTFWRDHISGGVGAVTALFAVLMVSDVEAETSKTESCMRLLSQRAETSSDAMGVCAPEDLDNYDSFCYDNIYKLCPDGITKEQCDEAHDPRNPKETSSELTYGAGSVVTRNDRYGVICHHPAQAPDSIPIDWQTCFTSERDAYMCNPNYDYIDMILEQIANPDCQKQASVLLRSVLVGTVPRTEIGRSEVAASEIGQLIPNFQLSYDTLNVRISPLDADLFASVHKIKVSALCSDISFSLLGAETNLDRAGDSIGASLALGATGRCAESYLAYCNKQEEVSTGIDKYIKSIHAIDEIRSKYASIQGYTKVAATAGVRSENQRRIIELHRDLVADFGVAFEPSLARHLVEYGSILVEVGRSGSVQDTLNKEVFDSAHKNVQDAVDILRKFLGAPREQRPNWTGILGITAQKLLEHGKTLAGLGPDRREHACVALEGSVTVLRDLVQFPLDGESADNKRQAETWKQKLDEAEAERGKLGLAPCGVQH